MATRYDDHPEHPLFGIPQEVLDAARTRVRECVDALSDPEDADPIADSVVSALHEEGFICMSDCTSYSIIDKAKAVASAAHAGQTDKAGKPYFSHPARVADRVAEYTRDPVLIAAAYLHDVLEDTAVTAADLLLMGFPIRTVEIVTILTRREGESHADAVERARSDPSARIVKYADVEDNRDSDRLSFLDDRTRIRLERKYDAALEALAPTRKERSQTCACLCHDTGGGSHNHPGESCYCKTGKPVVDDWTTGVHQPTKDKRS